MAAVFFDIDGTVWDRENVIPESTIRSIQMLHKNGHLAFLCSGRTRVMIFGDHLLSLGFDGILGGCGTYIEYQGEQIYLQEIEKEKLDWTVSVLHKYNLPILLEAPQELYMDAEMMTNGYGKYIKERLGELVYPIAGNEERMHACKMCVELNGRAYEKAAEILKEEYNLLVHGEQVLEMVPKSHSKATGIQEVCRYLGIDHKDTYAFGDSINDKDMLEYVAHGVAMGNGTPEVKAVADYVTTDIHEDGIYNGLKHFGLI